MTLYKLIVSKTFQDMLRKIIAKLHQVSATQGALYIYIYIYIYISPRARRAYIRIIWITNATNFAFV